MARNLGLDGGVDVADRIRVEAAQLFHHRGYGMTAIRDIAEAAGISSSTMYHHYRNKQDVLFAISRQFMTDFNNALLPILSDSTRPHQERLDAAIKLHLTISNERRTELLTIRGNRGALSLDQLRTIVRLQTAYQRAVREVVAVIQGSGPVDAELITMALMDLINGVCQWFAPSGSLTIDEIAERYLRMARSLVSGGVPPRRATRMATPG
ncbi:TetR/AcrR family transcriptional regulator [Nocardia sp. CWNU-33]|uniref:TetR/AcrR family transcriptional regulator n=1 Tax=Nocardia sp. CWNU-33 TaxID=3392117 RepID=UPI00398EDD7D